MTQIITCFRNALLSDNFLCFFPIIYWYLHCHQTLAMVQVSLILGGVWKNKNPLSRGVYNVRQQQETTCQGRARLRQYWSIHWAVISAVPNWWGFLCKQHLNSVKETLGQFIGSSKVVRKSIETEVHLLYSVKSINGEMTIMLYLKKF